MALSDCSCVHCRRQRETGRRVIDLQRVSNLQCVVGSWWAAQELEQSGLVVANIETVASPAAVVQEPATDTDHIWGMIVLAARTSRYSE